MDRRNESTINRNSSLRLIMRLVSHSGNHYRFDPGPDPLGQGRHNVDVTRLEKENQWKWSVPGRLPSGGRFRDEDLPAGITPERVARYGWGRSGARATPAINFATDLGRTFKVSVYVLYDDGEVVGVTEQSEGFHRALEAALGANNWPRRVVYWPPDLEPVPAL
jgi:hypothetical protein